MILFAFFIVSEVSEFVIDRIKAEIMLITAKKKLKYNDFFIFYAPFHTNAISKEHTSIAAITIISFLLSSLFVGFTVYLSIIGVSMFIINIE